MIGEGGERSLVDKTVSAPVFSVHSWWKNTPRSG